MMKQSRLDRINPDKTPKYLRRRMSNKEFFLDILQEKRFNARLYGEYVELAESLLAKEPVITIDATSWSVVSEKKLHDYFIEKKGSYPKAILIYNIRHIQPREQAARFDSMLKRNSLIVPEEVPVLFIEDATGEYLLAREIIQNTDLLMQSKCYIFISHSHKDILKVRVVRNYLENHDFEPILFYLRCMDNENEDTKNLRELIHKEIDAREWFLYLDSTNSRSSDWVQDEIGYIEKSQDHIVRRLCIDNLSENELIQNIDDLIGKLSIYICSSHSDKELANMVYEEFSRYGFKVFLAEKDLLPGKLWRNSTNQGIDIVSQNGGIVFLMTKDSMQSKTVCSELERAISLNGRVYPICFDEDIIKNPGDEINRLLVQNIQWIKCRSNAEGVHECAEKIIRDIKSMIVG